MQDQLNQMKELINLLDQASRAYYQDARDQHAR